MKKKDQSGCAPSWPIIVLIIPFFDMFCCGAERLVLAATATGWDPGSDERNLQDKKNRPRSFWIRFSLGETINKVVAPCVSLAPPK